MNLKTTGIWVLLISGSLLVHLSVAMTMMSSTKGTADGVGALGIEIGLGVVSEPLPQVVTEEQISTIEQDIEELVEEVEEVEEIEEIAEETLPEKRVVEEEVVEIVEIVEIIEIVEQGYEEPPITEEVVETSSALESQNQVDASRVEALATLSTLNTVNVIPASAGGGRPGIEISYVRQLQSLLAQNKRYPRAARSRRQEGLVLLYFVIDSNGNILQSEIRQGSGYTLLDEEALNLLQRSQPLPSIPAELNRNTMELLVPIGFAINPR